MTRVRVRQWSRRGDKGTDEEGQREGEENGEDEGCRTGMGEGRRGRRDI